MKYDVKSIIKLLKKVRTLTTLDDSEELILNTFLENLQSYGSTIEYWDLYTNMEYINETNPYIAYIIGEILKIKKTHVVVLNDQDIDIYCGLVSRYIKNYERFLVL